MPTLRQAANAVKPPPLPEYAPPAPKGAVLQVLGFCLRIGRIFFKLVALAIIFFITLVIVIVRGK